MEVVIHVSEIDISIDIFRTLFLVSLIIILLFYFLDPEDGTHKDGVKNSKLKIVLVCPSTRMTGIKTI